MADGEALPSISSETNHGLHPSDVQQGTSNVPEIAQVEVSTDGSKAQSNSEDKETKYQYAVFSFIRHAHSRSNVTYCEDDANVLTPLGREQARELGQGWANVRIDAISSSDLERARATAQAIVDFHSSMLELKTTYLLREQDHGPEVAEYMGRGDNSNAVRLRTGGYPYGSQLRRLHCPPSGESLTEVVTRGVTVLRRLITRHGRYLPSPPTELLEDPPFDGCKSADQLPDGVPHIVVVSHNVILSELYEALLSWNAEQHCNLGVDHRNTGWSRFIVGLGDRRLESPQGYYQKEFGLDLTIKCLGRI